MKITRAVNKIYKAIDAMIDLQQDYNKEIILAGITYDVQVTLDNLQLMASAINNIK